MTPSSPLDHRTFPTAQLFADSPPIFHNTNKQLVFELACPPNVSHAGELVYSRWSAMALPETFDARHVINRAIGREAVYDYVPALAADGGHDWHVNFADPNLFMAYASGLFAQDEMQVAEHPVLGALLERLRADGAVTKTEVNGAATPVLIAGAARRCRVATNRDATAGRPHGLYGNVFASASPEVIRAATTPIDPPTLTNLIAIAAPRPGYGSYRAAEIQHVLVTAYTGFRAAVLHSAGAPVAVHTGFWGCGAFGGNRELMAMLQVVAAGMAGVERLVFYTFDAAGSAVFERALATTARVTNDSAGNTAALVRQLTSMGFEWGFSDGN